MSLKTLALLPSRTTPLTTRGGMFPVGAVLHPSRPFSKFATSFVFSAASGAGVAGAAGGAETGTVWAGASGAAGAGASSGGVIGPVIPTGSPAEIPITGVGPTAFLVTATGLLAITATPIGAGTACGDGDLAPGRDRDRVAEVATPISGARLRSGATLSSFHG